VLEYAGTTSHTVILARSLGVPTVAGVKNARLVLSPGQRVVVDANRGFVIPQWTPAVARFYEGELQTLQQRQAILARYRSVPAITADGRKIEVGANVSSAEELTPAFEKGAEGIGLFRTEMLFVARENAPSEEEQFEVYARAARAASGRQVIIRTLDIGGDKPLPYLKVPQESNPFLGYRGVRIYAEHEELVRAQLRAILRASAFGRIKMMVPMVSMLGEMLWVKAVLARVQEELKSEHIVFNPATPIGMMIEVPSAAAILDQLCKEVDFFSIGTNDLSQYFFAVDRGNPKVASLSSVRHPGFLRLLKQIVDDVHAGGKWVGMCGEMAADIRKLPLLLGMGLDEMSLPASQIAALKRKISRLAADDCKQLLSRAISSRKVEEVEELLERYQPSEAAHPLLYDRLVIFGSESESKDEAIRELVDALYVAERTEERQRLEEALWAREAVYSTGLGFGFAIPHCKSDAVTADSIGILKLARPIEWGSLDGKPVSVVILLAVRESQANSRHMQVLSKLARKLMNEEFREQLMRIAEVKALLAYVAKELEIGL